jgi:hypothetical protein
VRGEAVRVEEGRKVRTCEEEPRSAAVSWRQRRAGSRACGIKANARDRRARAGSACMRAGSTCGRGISAREGWAHTCASSAARSPFASPAAAAADAADAAAASAACLALFTSFLVSAAQWRVTSEQEHE